MPCCATTCSVWRLTRAAPRSRRLPWPWRRGRIRGSTARRSATARVVKAAELLAREYTLVATNVPYLGRGRQHETLKNYCEKNYPDAKADLATCFVERSLAFCAAGGTAALVTPQNWLFLGTYKKLRTRLLQAVSWNLVARLGPRAFETISGEVVNVALMVLTQRTPLPGEGFAGLDVAEEKDAGDKRQKLLINSLAFVDQSRQTRMSDSVISFQEPNEQHLLSRLARSFRGHCNGDSLRF